MSGSPGAHAALTRTIVVDAARPDPGALVEAASVLRGGGLVAFPTESFYGLGTSALAPAAVARVFDVKGRPESKPLLVLVGSAEDAAPLCAEIGEGARELMRRHWPGPLTLVLRAAAGVPTAVTAGTGTIGVRMPGHPVALGLVRAAGLAVTAPSANPSGEAPPETADAVRRYFDGRIDMVLDGGPTSGGPGSTVADCTVWPPRILRQGPVRLS